LFPTVSHGDQTTPLTTDVPDDLGEEGEEYSDLTTGMWNSLKSEYQWKRSDENSMVKSV
jgi:hypothetical protein